MEMVKVKEVDFPRGPVPKSGSNSARETKKTKQPSFLQDIFQERPEIVSVIPLLYFRRLGTLGVVCRINLILNKYLFLNAG